MPTILVAITPKTSADALAASLRNEDEKILTQALIQILSTPQRRPSRSPSHPCARQKKPPPKCVLVKTPSPYGVSACGGSAHHQGLLAYGCPDAAEVTAGPALSISAMLRGLPSITTRKPTLSTGCQVSYANLNAARPRCGRSRHDPPRTTFFVERDMSLRPSCLSYGYGR